MLLAAAALVGCDAISTVPTYSGISVEGMNYTPFNLYRFTIRDKYGNRAGGGGDLMPGAGEGSLTCCYKLEGTDFTVNWEVYDADEAIKAIHAKKPIESIHKVTQVHFPKTTISGDAGEVVLAVHFYPDDHVEFEFRNDLRGSRIDYAAVAHWFDTKYGQKNNRDGLDEASAFRRSARIAAQGWLKYRLTDTADLKQYVYYTLIVNPKFDEDPVVQRILQETKGRPGAFGAAMQKLPDTLVQEIKSNRLRVSRQEQRSD
jgi:hypothetical protein